APAQTQALHWMVFSPPCTEIDGKPRAYIIDALRHPAEVKLLRKLYQDAFFLVGVVCDPDVREARLINELYEFSERGQTATKDAVVSFMERDADAPEKHGQHVLDTFHEADFFVDNSENSSGGAQNTHMNESLRRFVDLIISDRVIRPSVSETAMYHAHAAKLQSACLSRQVGAALIDDGGNIIAAGTNEVPKAGGGVYGEVDDLSGDDERCVFRASKYCSNNREQNDIITDLFDKFPSMLDGKTREDAFAAVRSTKIGGLIEFSRAVHAEMDAIISAGRIGVSTVGSRLYVSTFPCHYCARHIVTAGVFEVHYIEPYPKSRALALHSDSITVDRKEYEDINQKSNEKKIGKRKVLFTPFVGVSPRMYAVMFLKDRDYKNKLTGEYFLGKPDWGGQAEVFQVHYSELEEQLAAVE
uniref:deoxycytidylate deaminase n=1 Tax=uncultured Bosea sp. TaxID=211457 RepID=UPI0025D03C78